MSTFTEEELERMRSKLEEYEEYFSKSTSRRKAIKLARCLVDTNMLKSEKNGSARMSMSLVPLYREYCLKNNCNTELNEKIYNYLTSKLGRKFIWSNPENINYQVDRVTVGQMLKQAWEEVNEETDEGNNTGNIA